MEIPLEAARPRERESPWNESACLGIRLKNKHSKFDPRVIFGNFLRQIIDTHQS